ncbi:MAG: adenosylcobinamide-GDP ribazoletransferase [Pseudomonas sp.]|nr:adenosylcobinamide-GDP ribazoletransferase [Pseudomonas sp.]
MLPFWIALQFLSSLPIRLPGMPQPQELGRSLLFYPLVGLLFGVLLWSLNGLLAGAPLLLHAALLLSAWVLLSGGLHLDGLADSADAWLGGFGDRERTLTIMKDPRSGPIAVVTLVLVLLLKFCALLALIEQQHTAVLLIAPLIGRSALLAVFLTTPYVRAGGLGQALADHLPRKAGWWVLGFSAVACVVMAGTAAGIAPFRNVPILTVIDDFAINSLNRLLRNRLNRRGLYRALNGLYGLNLRL